jgi:hypothetical protein
MSNWLIVYDRTTQRLIQCDEYADSREAIRERFAIELESGATHEVVVLGADSLDTLRVTHARYFANEEG